MYVRKVKLKGSGINTRTNTFIPFFEKIQVLELIQTGTAYTFRNGALKPHDDAGQNSQHCSLSLSVSQQNLKLKCLATTS